MAESSGTEPSGMELDKISNCDEAGELEKEECGLEKYMSPAGDRPGLGPTEDATESER